ncbi:MAG: glycosyltransferase family 39 protein [Candidatus Eisenbacteria bacterium]
MTAGFHLAGGLRALRRSPARLVLVLFACFFLLLSGGRLGSGDASLQLQATMLLATTGRLGTTAPPAGADGGWVANRDGRYYEVHDIGNIGLMLPAAALSALMSKRPGSELVEAPPISARVGVSLTCALLSAIGCFFMFKLFALYHGVRRGFLLSLAFATTTIFWVYAKTAWDVTGACCLMCAALYFSAKLLHDSRPVRDTVLAAVALGLACSFRFSLAPFFVPSIILAMYLSRPRHRWWHYVAFLLCFLTTMLPDLGYNYVRMGSLFRPATTAPQHLQTNNALTGSILRGLFGLLFAPNRSLFIYSPILLLMVALPFMWGSIAPERRRLFSAFGAGCVPYILLIAKMKSWGAFGWGPRYLVPVIPVFFLGASLALTALWEKHRELVLGLVIVSVLVNAPAVLVNWNLTTTEFPQARDQNARLPRQMMATWTGLVMGLQGKPLPAPPEIANDPIRSAGRRFPDLWTVRLMEQSRFGLIAGLGISLLFTILIGWSLVFLLKRDRWGPRINQGGVG